MTFYRTTCSSDEFLDLCDRAQRKEIIIYAWEVGKKPAQYIVSWSEPDVQQIISDVDTKLV